MTYHRDISTTVGPLYPLHSEAKPPAVAMYSYERPAYIFWQGVFDQLLDNGLSEAQAFEWMQSKDARHMLDGITGAALQDIGKQAVLRTKEPL